MPDSKHLLEKSYFRPGKEKESTWMRDRKNRSVKSESQLKKNGSVSDGGKQVVPEETWLKTHWQRAYGKSFLSCSKWKRGISEGYNEEKKKKNEKHSLRAVGRSHSDGWGRRKETLHVKRKKNLTDGLKLGIEPKTIARRTAVGNQKYRLLDLKKKVNASAKFQVERERKKDQAWGRMFEVSNGNAT